ncbi:MAG: CsbD family protein [Rhodocyclaceae bacterium]|nr:CsbD family protein [Rhodocyclaceae bacterium]
MNTDIIKGNWKQLAGKVREQWGKLTDHDLDVIQGRREILAGKIQERYGYTRDEVDKHIRSWEKTLKN